MRLSRRRLFAAASGATMFSSNGTVRGEPQIPQGIRFHDALWNARNENGNQQAVSYYLFYIAGTLKVADVYADELLTTVLSQVPNAAHPSCTADSRGTFDKIYLDPSIVYRVQLYSPLGVKLEDIDPYIGCGITSQASLGAMLYPQTASERAADVVPVHYIHAPGNVLRYGADPNGIADCSSAFNAAAISGAGLMTLPEGMYKISRAVSIDISKTGLRGIGATIKSGFTTLGNLFEVMCTEGAEAATKNPVEGISFVGTGLANVICFDLNQASTGYVAGFSFRNCTFTAFDTFVRFRNNAFGVNFFGCTFSQQTGASGGIVIPNGYKNYGERISFSGCAFFNNRLAINCAWNSATLFFSDSSFDYSHQVITMSGGAALFQHCYFENNLDTAYWYETTGDCVMSFDHCYMAQTGPKPKFNWASSSASNIGSIVIRNSVLYSSSNTIVSAYPFVVATGASFGFAFGSNNRMIGFNPTSRGWAGISAASGLQPSINPGLPGYHVGSTSAGGDASFLGGGGPGGSGGIAFRVAIDGKDQYVYVAVACQAGENVGVSFQARTNHMGAPFECRLYAYDAAEKEIGSSALIDGFNRWDGATSRLTTTFNTYRTVFANVPAGTSAVRVLFCTSGATQTGYEVVLGNLGIFKY